MLFRSPTLVVSGPAGVLTDRLGSERVLIRAQWALLAAAVLGAIAIPISEGSQQDALLLLSTLGIGVASSYELTARNKYVALLVDEPEQLGPYLASFSVIFNVGKLVGPPLGGLLLAATGPTLALSLDAAPRHINLAAVEAALLDLPGVEAVEELHVWGLSTSRTALTTHLRLGVEAVGEAGGGDALLAAAQARLEALGIRKSTIQLERPQAPA